MNQSTATRVAWVLFAIAVVAFAGAAALSLAAQDPSAVLPFLPAPLVFATIGRQLEVEALGAGTTITGRVVVTEEVLR